MIWLCLKKTDYNVMVYKLSSLCLYCSHL